MHLEARVLQTIGNITFYMKIYYYAYRIDIFILKQA